MWTWTPNDPRVSLLNEGSCLPQLHKTATDHLIEAYHLERLAEQDKMEGQDFGSLFVRVYFNHDSLCVEVLQAKNVIPLDPNGRRQGAPCLRQRRLRGFGPPSPMRGARAKRHPRNASSKTRYLSGLSDPFVVVELLPRRLFPESSPQHTNVHKKTLNPMFDECFEL